MKEDTIPTETATEHEAIEDLEITREAECIDFSIGDNVVYPHHGAGQVIKKEAEGDPRRDAPVPHDQDPS